MNPTPAFSVRNLSLGKQPIAFDVQAGEVVAVIGDNGSGKSLLLAHLSGHLQTPRGAVTVGGRELRKALDDVGVVFQHPGLIRNMTVFENVALPFLVHGLDLDGALQEQVRLRMRLVGCGHLENEEVHRLSEGDKRCIALARALSGRTRFLVADEPVAALAPAKKALVEELLACLIQTKVLDGMILATQDLDFARRIATHFLLLHDGGHTFLSKDEIDLNEACRAFSTRAA